VHLAAGELPRVPAAAIDWPVLLVTLGIAMVSGLLFSAVPAIQTPHVEGGRGTTAGAGRQRLRQVLVTGQLAIAMVLVSGAGLMVRSFQRLMAVDPGFQSDHALAVRFAIPSYRYNDTTEPRFYATVLDRVRAVPGVVAVGSTKVLPLDGGEEMWSFAVVGQPPPAGRAPQMAPTFHVSPDYFRTMSIPVVAGREFTSRDSAGAPDVLVINESFARAYVPGALDAVPGRVLTFGDTSHHARIVGVVRDIHQDALDAAPRPALYVAAPQNMRSTVTLVVRTRGDPAAMAAAVRRAIWSVDKDQAIAAVTTLDRVRARAVARPRLLSILLAMFGTLGLALGALGLYGVVAYMVRQRQMEIGIRVALGADGRRVLALVMRRGVTVTLIGLGVGLVTALAAARGMRAVLFQVTPADPTTYAVVAVLLALVALAATYIPARAALRVDPMHVLRPE
jgi:putative ABC transport system permease protein